MALPDPIELAVPVFVGFILLEVLLSRWKRAEGQYELRDSAASLAMGSGYLLTAVVTGSVVYAITDWVHQYRLLDIGYQWWAFAGILVLEDVAYYWFHRLSHEHRLWWAAHVNHHSSQHYNFTTALRQSWTSFAAGTFVVWLPLALIGFPPALIAFQKGVSLVYQFFVHTEAVGKLPRPIELVLNTPSHHRVHHANNPRYVDRNYAGIFIVWDRLFGTFVEESEAEPCRYGLVKQIGTFNPLRIAFHEWWAMLRDVASARSLTDRVMYVFGPPGWSSDGSRKTSAQLRAEYRRRCQQVPAELTRGSRRP